MDSALRNEQRERGLRPMPMPVPVSANTNTYRPRPPLVASHQSNDAFVDLTQDDDVGQKAMAAHSRPSPTNGFMYVPPNKQNAASSSSSTIARPPALSAAGKQTNMQGSWQMPAKSKHAAPSKVRMFDATSMPPQASQQSAPMLAPTPDSPLPSSSYRTQGQHHTAKKLMHDGAHIIKHVIKDGFARLESALEQANSSPHASQSSVGRPFIVPDDEDDENAQMNSTFAGPTLTAEEREQQLQDMLNSMVLPPELSDIDLEKASNVQGLKCKLMPHQVAGYLWLKGREAGKHKGGILADDMGLGKTVQMLALLVGNAPSVADSTINKVRHEPEKSTKKSKKKVIPDADEPPPATAKEEVIEIKSKCTLIVAPLAVIRQWEREIKEKTSPNLKVLVHHGTARTKTASTFSKYDVVITTYPTIASEWNNIAGSEKAKKSKKGGKQIVSDSSEGEDDDEDEVPHTSKDSDDDSFEGPVHAGVKKNNAKVSSSSTAATKKKLPPAPLFDADWLRIVLDEAQNIKNHRTKASSACAALSRNALSKWCLSGTPIQNEAMEMFSLIRFLGIPPFNEYAHFREKISDPLKSTNQNRVNWGMKRLCAVLTTIMLRRTKDTTHDGKPILTLPERNVEIVSSDFDSDKERQFYSDLESQVKRNFEDAEEAGTKVNHMVTLLMLLRLRQACSHPSLVNRNVSVDAGAANGQMQSGAIQDGGKAGTRNDDDDDDGLTEMLAGLSVASKRCDRCQTTMSREETSMGQSHCGECVERMRIDRQRMNGGGWEGKESTKIRQMLRILNEIRTNDKDEKTIVFSQFTSFLDLLEPFLRQEGHEFVRYDGSMRPEERERALDKIRGGGNGKSRVILISFKAGNVGLNLTCCSRVILMDLWWNPMLEAQSIDRAHRLGQTRNVYVYKLVIQDSVEERILALQDKKRALAEAALEGSKLSKANRLDKKELMYLFSGGPVA